jgi:poly-gamma-glutamate synthesis protein (capsule biosynthesis protein)
MIFRGNHPKQALMLLGIFFCITISAISLFRRGSVKGEKDAVVLPMLTATSVFDLDNHPESGLDPQRVRTLIATGDVIPARSVNQQATNRNDFHWPYLNIAPLLNSADITLINLESPFVTGCQTTISGMVFCGDVRNVEGLVYAGVDVANLANNHLNNYGVAGVNETVKLLNQNNILTSGLGEPAFTDVRGIKFAFIGYNDLLNDPQIVTKIQNDIKSIRNQANVIVVSFHWGNEYTRQPTKRQKMLAHTAIDAGADVIIGNHPHWIEPLEIYQGKVIMYAHGNTVFDQMWSEETKLGVIGKYTFYDNRLIGIDYTPVKIRDYGQPEILTGAEKTAVLDLLRDSSLDLEKNSD